MSLAVRISLFFLAFYTIFAQPGIPACWLMQKACGFHTHLAGMADRPHTHEYLFDMASAMNAIALPQVFFSASLLVMLMSLINLWRGLHSHVIAWSDFTLTVQLPPPR